MQKQGKFSFVKHILNFSTAAGSILLKENMRLYRTLDNGNSYNLLSENLKNT